MWVRVCMQYPGGWLTRTQAWFYGEGLKLPVEPSYDITLADPPYSLAARWDTSRTVSDVTKLDFAASDVQTFDSNQKSEPSMVMSLQFLTLL